MPVFIIDIIPGITYTLDDMLYGFLKLVINDLLYIVKTTSIRISFIEQGPPGLYILTPLFSRTKSLRQI